MNGDKKKALAGIWRQRGRRMASGANVCSAILLAAVILAMLNYLAARHYFRWDISRHGYYALSEKTRSLLASIRTTVTIVAFMDSRAPFHDDITNLLKEYQYEAAKNKALKLNVEIIDPDRELARAKELRKDFDKVGRNTIVFECGGRKKFVEVAALTEQETEYQRVASGLERKSRVTGFLGERAFTSSIQSVTQNSSPVVYFLSGHGEHDLGDFQGSLGYGSLMTCVRRDNIEPRPLVLAERKRIPEDCSALVLAGPRACLTLPEVEVIRQYLETGGRLLALLDAGSTTGLEDLLRIWGVQLAQDVALDPALTFEGLLFTYRYSAHPVVRGMQKLPTVFQVPRSVEPVQGFDDDASNKADRPRVSVLVTTTKNGWAESDLKNTPPVFNEGADRQGPVSLAVAVEKGAGKDIEVAIKSSRIVVAGDSYFVSNAMLKAAGSGNVDLFLSALNWLVEREALMAIGPKTPRELRLDMNRDQAATATLAMLAGLPGLAALLGLWVWSRRRH